MVLARDGAGIGKLTILVVDDSLTFRSALGERLRAAGHDVVLAASGVRAIEALVQTPDVVIVDLEMPGIDGLETCRRIRRARKGAMLPILMLTAREDAAARIQGRSAGASEFLVKGADFEAVVARVGDFLRRTTVFARVVAASGLARIIAEAAITRACERAGVDAGRMTVKDLERTLPEIERSLGMFLSAAERGPRFEAIAAIAGRTGRAGDG